jgi:hypothetical protein
MKKRILVLLSVVALMVVMLAFFVAIAYAAKGEHGRDLACEKIQGTPAFGQPIPFCETTD